MKCLNWMDYKEITEFTQTLDNFDVLILGNCSGLDERSSYLESLFSENHKNIIRFKVYYDEEDDSNLNILLDGSQINVKESSALAEKLINQKILIDMTCFDVQDLTYLLYMLCKEQLPFSVSYVEPKEYKKKDGINATSLSSSGDHLLSDEGNGINYLPPFIPLPGKDSSIYVLSLGFEPYRLAGFMSSDEIDVKSEKSYLLGLPAFDIGWERKTINANYKHIKSDTPNIQIVPADDPIQTYIKIKEIYQSLTQNSQQINLLPIGTKPQTLGMIWFALDQKLVERKNNIGLMYDFVKKIPNRTIEIRNIHVWKFIH